MKYDQIYIFENEDTKRFHEYLVFNGIGYNYIDCWDPEDLAFVVPPSIQNKKNACLICSQLCLYDLASSEKSWESVVAFLQHNTIIATRLYDTCVSYYRSDFNESLKKIDSCIPHGSLQLILDCDTTCEFWAIHCENIQCVTYPLLCQPVFPRISGANVEKHNCEHDFFITTMLKENRPLRPLLKNALESRKELASHGLCFFNTSRDKWHGEVPEFSGFHKWYDGHPSMDIYNNSWLEIVPEGEHKDFYYITEKTVKPIVTKTPFLVLSTPGFLEFLRTQGFKTFSPYIKEDYDSEPDMSKRVDLVLDSLEEAIHYGAERVYQKTRHILEHNYNKMAEKCGRLQHDTDLFIKSLLT